MIDKTEENSEARLIAITTAPRHLGADQHAKQSLTGRGPQAGRSPLRRASALAAIRRQQDDAASTMGGVSGRAVRLPLSPTPCKKSEAK